MFSPARGLCAIGMLIGMMAPAQADPSMECSGQSSSQVEIGDCLAKVSKIANSALDTTLGFAMNAATELDKVTGRAAAVPALKAGQAAWSQYRDSHCEYVGSTFGGGSGTGIAILSCRIELARARSDQLMQFAQ